MQYFVLISSLFNAKSKDAVIVKSFLRLQNNIISITHILIYKCIGPVLDWTNLLTVNRLMVYGQHKKA